VRNPRVTALRTGALAVALLLAVSGCAPTQTKKAACTTLIKAVDAATSSINGALPTFSSDPDGTSSVLARTSTTFHKDIAKVTNPDIAKVADTADEAVSSLAADVKKESADPTAADFTKLGKSSQAVSAAFVDIRQTCE
jgi:hypothetical protein